MRTLSLLAMTLLANSAFAYTDTACSNASGTIKLSHTFVIPGIPQQPVQESTRVLVDGQSQGGKISYSIANRMESETTQRPTSRNLVSSYFAIVNIGIDPDTGGAPVIVLVQNMACEETVSIAMP